MSWEEPHGGWSERVGIRHGGRPKSHQDSCCMYHVRGLDFTLGATDESGVTVCVYKCAKCDCVLCVSVGV